jgi:urease accessory protein
MNLRDGEPLPAGWQARLELEYSAPAAERTVLSHRRHHGPLVVQKPFYPEGPRVCHSTLLHPPGGIAGGDCLELNIVVHPGAHAVITTPGAAKWYRSSGPTAQQRAEVCIGRDAMLEWLPQPGIVFNGARAQQAHRVHLGTNARYIGWEIVCLGRVARGERFEAGEYRISTEIATESGRLWSDCGVIRGGGAVLTSHAGFAGQPVTGLFLACGAEIQRELIDRCREVAVSAPARCGVTSLPSVLAARVIAGSTETAWHYFTALWEIVRPALMGRVACPPRIWQT